MKSPSIILLLLLVASTTRAAVVSPQQHPQPLTTTTASSSSKQRRVSTTLAPTTKNEPITRTSAIQVQSGASQSPAMANLLHRLQVGFYFGLWYALNIFYNIVNKKVLNALPAPALVGCLQLGLGALYVMVLWTTGLRARPVLTVAGRTSIRQVGLAHGLGQLATTCSLGAGPVSFTHIVKALEPFFSAMVSVVCLGQVMPVPVYLTLLPVVGGVGYACLKERAFSWLAFGMAMTSNLAFALRAVLSKVAMQTPNLATVLGTHLNAANLYGLVTVSAFFISLPLALVAEGKGFMELTKQAVGSADGLYASKGALWQAVALSGAFHYLNNEVMFLALSKVHPVTLAVGNTMKRVFIMVASVLVFRNPISFQSGVGAAIGIAGVLLYSLTKQHYETKAKAAAQ